MYFVKNFPSFPTFSVLCGFLSMILCKLDHLKNLTTFLIQIIRF